MRLLGVTVACFSLSACTASSGGVARHATGPSASSSPTDCDSIQAGDKVDVKSLQCNQDKVPVTTMECEAGTYVHLTRAVAGDLEAIVGLTPTWKGAEPIDVRYGRTVWAFQHCKEHG